ncbi:MAG TPA: helix-turn-helix transcriptional regulator [Marinobacter sp.]|nr:helix-turn-helix transcriptional regulator [Marinobacter sp.]
MIEKETLNQIHRLWDELPNFPASASEASLRHLLDSVGTLVNADHGYWLASLRMDHCSADDVMQGWRPGPIYYYQALDVDKKLHKIAVREIESGEPNESVVNHIRNAGTFRATLLRDHVSPAFFESSHYRSLYQARSISDTLFVVAPVNPDSEVYFGFHKIGDNARFTEQDLAVASYALRSLTWYYRQLLLSFGVLVAGEALTPTERRVLHLLLTGMSEKEIAADLGQSPATTHKYVTTLYRKYNVKSRAALTALWLGHD